MASRVLRIASYSDSIRSLRSAIQSHSLTPNQIQKLGLARKVYYVNGFGQCEHQIAIETKEIPWRDAFDCQIDVPGCPTYVKAGAKEQNSLDTVSPADIPDGLLISLRHHDAIILWLPPLCQARYESPHRSETACKPIN